MARKLHKKKKAVKAKKTKLGQALLTAARKLTKAQLERRRRLKAQRARRAREGEYRQKMAANGLVEPTPHMTRRQKDQLQREWYKRLAADEAEKAERAEANGREYDAFTDIEWLENPNSPHIARPASRGRKYDATKMIYFACARNYLTHKRFETKMQRYAWSLHTEGESYRSILEALKAKYKISKSIYWMFYYIQDCATKCLKWNQTHPEGMLNPANQDSFAGDALISNWSLQLDEGYWESVKKQ